MLFKDGTSGAVHAEELMSSPNKKLRISTLFARAGAVACGVAAGVTAVKMVPGEVLLELVLVSTMAGLSISSLMALRKGSAGEQQFEENVRTVVYATLAGATGLVGLAGATGAYIGYYAGRAVGSGVEATRSFFAERRAFPNTPSNG